MRKIGFTLTFLAKAAKFAYHLVNVPMGNYGRQKKNCKYNNCTHTHEPECAVKEALKNNTINTLRYENYLRVMEDEEDKYRTDKFI